MRNEYDFSEGKRGPVIPLEPDQVRLTLYLDADIINYFKEHVHIEQQKESLEATLRRVIREELPVVSTPVHQVSACANP